jgi:hypothetical protein
MGKKEIVTKNALHNAQREYSLSIGSLNTIYSFPRHDGRLDWHCHGDTHFTERRLDHHVARRGRNARNKNEFKAAVYSLY